MKSKVIRGGSWIDYEDRVRADFRLWAHPDDCGDDGGFRVLRVPHEQARKDHVLRGGSWLSAQDVAHADSRLDFRPGYRNANLGFRVLRTSK